MKKKRCNNVKHMKQFSRRDFIRNSGLAAAGIPLMTVPGVLQPLNMQPPTLEVHLFSKHLHFLGPEQAAEVAASLGFNGLDLTVRPKGHVEPVGVRDILPGAIEAIHRGGSRCSLITTAVEDVEEQTDKDVLETAAAAGVNYYRSNWYRYQQELSMKESIDRYAQKIAELAELNKKLGLTGCYQNHAGNLIGASLWEVNGLLASADTEFFGLQYDIRHATVEGGLSWENGLRLIHDKIKTIVLKDFKWSLVNGQWQVVNTPIGEGMVNFKRYFRLLKDYGIRVPASLHLEYPLGGAEHGASVLNIDRKLVFLAMKKDLNTVKDLWEQA